MRNIKKIKVDAWLTLALFVLATVLSCVGEAGRVLAVDTGVDRHVLIAMAGQALKKCVPFLFLPAVLLLGAYFNQNRRFFYAMKRVSMLVLILYAVSVLVVGLFSDYVYTNLAGTLIEDVILFMAMRVPGAALLPTLRALIVMRSGWVVRLSLIASAVLFLQAIAKCTMCFSALEAHATAAWRAQSEKEDELDAAQRIARRKTEKIKWIRWQVITFFVYLLAFLCYLMLKW